MSDSSSSSTSAFVSTLILYGIIGGVMYTIFSIMRPKQPNVYQPKALEIASLEKNQRPPSVSSGVSAWITELWSRQQAFFLQFIGLDGYFFVRYIGIFALISLLGCLILLPILLPVNATNGKDYEGFELLSFANITNNNRYYAHVFLSWIFFGLIIWVIYKEMVNYITLRHSVQSSPLYDGLLSSRTILITDLPERLLSETELKETFHSISNVWYARNYKELSDLVKERTKLSNKYEGALNKVVKKSFKYKQKLIKKSKPVPEKPEDLIEKNPTHRLGKIPFVGEKVQTIDYSLEKLPELNGKISKLQENPNEQDQVGSVFIEFVNQLEAQRAYQYLRTNKEIKGDFSIGVAPEDIIWDNLSLTKTKQHGKRVLANTFLTLMIIFWAIPVAVVGCISNITFLTEKVHFLRFINNCPNVILGLITGVLPTVALAVLMSFVPVIIKAIGKIGGFKTYQQLELYCQSWYYGFQVVQSFLVMTLASSASSTVVAIINDPSSAMTLLAQNLPKASNFYISYFLLQGLYSSAWTILQAVSLALAHALAFLLNTPRKKWSKQNLLSKPSFGVIYPGQQLLVLLMIVYSIISPIILVFTTFTLILFYFVQLYIYTYVQGQGVDFRGRNYPKALFQTFVALYLAEICLLGLFIMAKTWGPVALEAIMLAVTVLAHLYLRYKFEKCFDIVPISTLDSMKHGSELTYPNDCGLKESKDVASNYSNIGDHSVIENTNSNADPFNEEPLLDSNSSKNETYEPKTTESKYIENEINKESQDFENPIEKKSLNSLQTLKKFIYPTKPFDNFQENRNHLPPIFNLTPRYSSDYLKNAYQDPAINAEILKFWIPKDPNGVSTYEIEKASEKEIFVTDENAIINEKGKLEVTGPPPAYELEVKH